MTGPFSINQSYPRRVFTEADFSKTYLENQLTPSSTLIVVLVSLITYHCLSLILPDPHHLRHLFRRRRFDLRLLTALLSVPAHLEPFQWMVRWSRQYRIRRCCRQESASCTFWSRSSESWSRETKRNAKTGGSEKSELSDRSQLTFPTFSKNNSEIPLFPARKRRRTRESERRRSGRKGQFQRKLNAIHVNQEVNSNISDGFLFYLFQL